MRPFKLPRPPKNKTTSSKRKETRDRAHRLRMNNKEVIFSYGDWQIILFWQQRNMDSGRYYVRAYYCDAIRYWGGYHRSLYAADKAANDLIPKVCEAIALQALNI